MGVTCSLWRRKVQLSLAEKNEAHNRTAAELMRTKMIAEVGLERQRMAAELERLQQQLSKEERHRVQLQENLKRVFMRGVCALNFEAMTLLNPSTADGVATGTGALKENVAPPLNQVGFDWANFESQKTALVSAGAAFGQKAHHHEPAESLLSGGEAAIPLDLQSGLPEVDVVISARSEEPAVDQEQTQGLPFVDKLIEAHESPRANPPCPSSAPPNQSTEFSPLPFVNYAGPEAATPAGPLSKPSPAKSATSSSAKAPASTIPKERRWQTAMSGARVG